jgi:hypothetical protein
MNRLPMTEYADHLARPTNRTPNTGYDSSHRTSQRSTTMYSMHEALARDRMRESEQRSREARLTRSLAAQRRWHRVSLRARAAEERHALRASQVVAVR